MFNETYKNEAVRDLERSNAQYMRVFKQTMNDTSRLLLSRRHAVKTIRSIEDYVDRLANKPRNYEVSLGRINFQYQNFEKKLQQIKEMDEVERSRQCGSAGASCLLAGAAAAPLAPMTAMGTAMVFGTASTGTAISSLSGIAAVKASLAWLGGGAVAAGGAGGAAVLAAAGPVGFILGVAGASVGNLIKSAISNQEIAEKAEAASRTIIRETERIKAVDLQVLSWNRETIHLSNELMKKLTIIRRKRDYNLYSKAEKEELAMVMNMTEVLSKKLGEKIR